MALAVPRVVVVTRPTEFESLLARHATRGQARFFLEMRGQCIEPVEQRHQRFLRARHRVIEAVPRTWRRTSVTRADLDRFLFEPEDLVVVLGQDGLVANTAKYLRGQQVIGLNPDPTCYDGVLVQHSPAATADLLAAAHAGRAAVQSRTMVEAVLDDGQRLIALNELFVGHASHQSARYDIACGGMSEAHSSSGVIIATGTGSTGWARSINRCRAESLDLPRPTDPMLAFFVREAFPSIATGVELCQGLLRDESLALTSRMNDGGVIFGDGIEDDRLAFSWGRTVTIGVAPALLNLVCG